MGSKGCLTGMSGEKRGLASHPEGTRAGEERRGGSSSRQRGPSRTRTKDVEAGKAPGTFLPVSSFPASQTQSFCATETKAEMCTLSVNGLTKQIKCK